MPKDYAKAVSWYRKAADAGNAAAMYNLGYMYVNGLGVARNCDEGAVWTRKAAEAGFPEAECEMGYLYQNGLGVGKDSSQAVAWYRKSAELATRSG